VAFPRNAIDLAATKYKMAFLPETPQHAPYYALYKVVFFDIINVN